MNLSFNNYKFMNAKLSWNLSKFMILLFTNHDENMRLKIQFRIIKSFLVMILCSFSLNIIFFEHDSIKMREVFIMYFWITLWQIFNSLRYLGKSFQRKTRRINNKFLTFDSMDTLVDLSLLPEMRRSIINESPAFTSRCRMTRVIL